MSEQSYAHASNIFLEKLKELPIEYCYLIVFHFSKNNLSYLRAWANSLPIIGIISIPYSEQTEVKEEISRYAKVYSPNLENIPGMIINICQENSDKKIILIEIGGYSSTIADKLSNVVLAVEDTARGHERFRENEQKLTYPVVSIARTEGKKMEDKMVGRAIAESTALTVGRLSSEIKDKNVLVMGYGGVGNATAKALKNTAASVMVYDPKPELIETARAENFNVPDRLDAIKSAEIIVGCSGHQSIQFEDISRLKQNALLISGSSRQVEFPYDKLIPFRDSSFNHELIEKFSFEGKSFCVAYKGQPINFYFDIGLGEVFDIPMTLLVQSIIWGLNNSLDRKLYDLPEKQVQEVISKLDTHF